MRIGNREFDLKNHTYVMGILNMTPDSFSDGGRWTKKECALHHVKKMLEEGADIIDVGGESTRPGYVAVSEDEEIERTAPIIEIIKAEFDVPISLDTYKSAVARAGIAAGADMINDIWGLKKDGDMAKAIAQSGVSCCLMHNREPIPYKDLMEDVKKDLEQTLAIAKAAGIPDDRIILDPGVGFAKTYQVNLRILHHLEALHSLGYPLLLGCSRKSVIGLSLDLPVEERLEGTLVTTVLGVYKGCGIVRVHDVLENVRTVKMAEAIAHCD